MLSFFLVIFVGLSSSDPIEAKGIGGLSYRVFVNQRTLCFQYKLGQNCSEPNEINLSRFEEIVSI